VPGGSIQGRWELLFLLRREGVAAPRAPQVLKVNPHPFIWRDAGIAMWAGYDQSGANLPQIEPAAAGHQRMSAVSSTFRAHYGMHSEKSAISF
jgi:hypothetical protein